MVLRSCCPINGLARCVRSLKSPTISTLARLSRDAGAAVHYDLWSRHFWAARRPVPRRDVASRLAAVHLAERIWVKDRRRAHGAGDRARRHRAVVRTVMPGYALLYRLVPPLQGIRTRRASATWPSWPARSFRASPSRQSARDGAAPGGRRRSWPLAFIGATSTRFGAIRLVDAGPVSPLHARLRHIRRHASRSSVLCARPCVPQRSLHA